MVRWAVWVVVGIAVPAPAATVFVDPAGVCNGQTPCFTTIQDGIDNSGPPPGVVFVFPGDYAESVDVSGSTGDLTLRTVNGAGVPTPGTASILPAAGAAIRNSVTPFPGDLTIDGFILQSPDDNGMTLSTVQGALILTNLVADGNGDNGISASVQSSVTITDSSFSGHTAGFGISLSGVVGTLTFQRLTADGNRNFNASSSLNAEVEIRDSSFSNSQTNFGLSLSGATDLTLERVTANGNQSFNASATLMGIARVVDSSFSNSVTTFGLSLAGATDATVDGVTADNNRSFNTSVSMMGVARVVDSSFRSSVTNFGLSFVGATDVALDRVTATGNSSFNTSFSLTGGPVRILASDFSNSKTNFGLSVTGASTATLLGVVADGNRSFNGSISATDRLHIEQSSFSRSVTNFGLNVLSTGDAVLRAVVAEGNAQNGVLATSTNLRVSGSRFTNNTSDGIRISAGEPGGIRHLRCNDIASNQRGLVLFAAELVDAENNWWGSATGPMHPSNPAGTGNPVIDGANGGAGTVDFVPFLPEPSAESGICHQHGAPALGSSALALLAIALLVLPAWRLSRRRAV